MISRPVFLEQIETLMAAFNYGLPEKSVAAYYDFLKSEFDDEGFRDVTEQIIKSNKRFPTVADFMEVKRAGQKPWYCCG